MKLIWKIIIGIILAVALGFLIMWAIDSINTSIKKNTATAVQSYFTAHKAEFKGAKGDKGDAGAQGSQGSAGKAGSAGKSGSDGVNGSNGANGQAGKAGSDGCTWLGWSDYYPYVDLGFVCP